MITIDQALQLLADGGSVVVNSQHMLLGGIRDVYFDNETGQPEWVTVSAGALGRRDAFVPLREAEVTGEGLRVPYQQDTVERAPRISDSEVCLSFREQSELRHYYGIGERGKVQTSTAAGTDTQPIALWAAWGTRSAPVPTLRIQWATVSPDLGGPLMDLCTPTSPAPYAGRGTSVWNRRREPTRELSADRALRWRYTR